MAQAETISDYIPAEEFSYYDHGRYEEMVQPLADLGYLQIDETAGNIASESDLAQAIAAFRKECIAMALLHENDQADSVDPSESNTSITVAAHELKLLQALTSLDGDFVTGYVPIVGDFHVWSRVLHFRLNIYGLLDREPATPVDAATLAALDVLGSWLKQSDYAQLVKTLGDVAAITLEVQQSAVFQHHVGYAKHAMRQSDRDELPVGLRFRDKLRNTIKQNSTEFKDFKKHVLQSVNTAFIEQQIADTKNEFVLRLLQIRLWVGGFYHDELDADIGPITLDALRELDALEEDGEDFKLKLLAAHIEGDYWVFNTGYFLQFCTQAMDDTDKSVSDTLQEYIDFRESLTGNEKKKLAKQESTAWKRINKTRSENMKAAFDKVRKRIYTGVKAMVSYLHRRWNQMKRWLRTGSKKLQSVVQSLYKVILSEVREGLRAFKHGMQFLLGKRTITSTADSGATATTLFDFDCDCRTTVSGELPIELAVSHGDKCRYYANSLHFSLQVVAKIIRFILAAASGVAWSAIVLEIARAFGKLVQEKLHSSTPTAALVTVT